MTQKERLVELMVESARQQRLYVGDDAIEVIENTADHLIDNGVIVPPCKVGDTVFKISEVCRLGLNPYSIYCEECLYHPFYSGSTEDRCECHYAIQKVIAKTKSWIVRNLVDSDKQRYWLTQEEAEQALKEQNDA